MFAEQFALRRGQSTNAYQIKYVDGVPVKPDIMPRVQPGAKGSSSRSSPGSSQKRDKAAESIRALYNDQRNDPVVNSAVMILEKFHANSQLGGNSLGGPNSLDLAFQSIDGQFQPFTWRLVSQACESYLQGLRHEGGVNEPITSYFLGSIVEGIANAGSMADRKKILSAYHYSTVLGILYIAAWATDEKELYDRMCDHVWREVLHEGTLQESAPMDSGASVGGISDSVDLSNIWCKSYTTGQGRSTGRGGHGQLTGLGRIAVQPVAPASLQGLGSRRVATDALMTGNSKIQTRPPREVYDLLLSSSEVMTLPLEVQQKVRADVMGLKDMQVVTARDLTDVMSRLEGTLSRNHPTVLVHASRLLLTAVAV